MASNKIGEQSFSKILSILEDLSRAEDIQSAVAKYPGFPNFAVHIAELFAEDRLMDVLPRVRTELEIVKKTSPKVRPALDPFVSTQLGVFSHILSDWEVGHFLDYPDCCIRPFAEEARFGLDERHAAELKGLKGKIFVTTAGFIPHSIFCGESLKKGLIAFVTEEELKGLHKLENELFTALPHMHTSYLGTYYEVRVA
jgi:hypothetical protein